MPHQNCPLRNEQRRPAKCNIRRVVNGAQILKKIGPAGKPASRSDAARGIAPIALLAKVTVSIAALWSFGEPVVADEYQLVWADEFNYDGPPDPKNWTFEEGFVRNNELQWYQPANARCTGGRLVIEARREQVENPHYDRESQRWDRQLPRSEYTSASLMTRDRHEWLYGRFVMRGRIDVRPGLWPAYWTLGTARPWPGCGEIDILESYGGKLLANAAWLGGPDGRVSWDSVDRPFSGFKDNDWTSKFHEWRMDWNTDRIKLFVDDQLFNEIDVTTAVNSDRERTHPFREPQYLLLNLAVGGTNGGDPTSTEFPARFEIDYVRVYQRPAPAPSSVPPSPAH